MKIKMTWPTTLDSFNTTKKIYKKIIKFLYTHLNWNQEKKN